MPGVGYQTHGRRVKDETNQNLFLWLEQQVTEKGLVKDAGETGDSRTSYTGGKGRGSQYHRGANGRSQASSLNLEEGKWGQKLARDRLAGGGRSFPFPEIGEEPDKPLGA